MVEGFDDKIKCKGGSYKFLWTKKVETVVTTHYPFLPESKRN